MSTNEITTSPESGKAKLVTGTEGADNSIVYVAQEDGTDGNSIKVKHVNPGTNGASLGVVVAGKVITVNLATNGSAAAISTADQVQDAIFASAPAKALVSTTEVGESNGTGVVAVLAETPLAGGQQVTVSSVKTHTVITDPTDPKAVQIPPEADATGRDELSVHEGKTPAEQILDLD